MEKTLKQQVKEHWQRMIKYASKQPKDKIVDCRDMKKEINENWYSGKCAFCARYKKEYVTCDLCPLWEKYGQCLLTNNKNLWGSVDRSKTWGEWTKNAKLFLKQIATI